MESVLSERTTRNKIVPVTKLYGGAYQNCPPVSRFKGRETIKKALMIPPVDFLKNFPEKAAAKKQ